MKLRDVPIQSAAGHNQSPQALGDPSSITSRLFGQPAVDRAALSGIAGPGKHAAWAVAPERGRGSLHLAGKGDLTRAYQEINSTRGSELFLSSCRRHRRGVCSSTVQLGYTVRKTPRTTAPQPALVPKVFRSRAERLPTAMGSGQDINAE
jgi:hypothetical protein